MEILLGSARQAWNMHASFAAHTGPRSSVLRPPFSANGINAHQNSKRTSSPRLAPQASPPGQPGSPGHTMPTKYDDQPIPLFSPSWLALVPA